VIEKGVTLTAEKEGLEQTDDQPENNRSVAAECSNDHRHDHHDNVLIRSQWNFQGMEKTVFHKDVVDTVRFVFLSTVDILFPQ
jgi:hypothetical protein